MLANTGKTEFRNSLVVKGKQLTAGPVLPGISEQSERAPLACGMGVVLVLGS